MIIKTNDSQTFDTNKDLTAPERHILQKLFAWRDMATSLEQFKEKKTEALHKGWNNSGPIVGGAALQTIMKNMEKAVIERLGAQ